MADLYAKNYPIDWDLLHRMNEEKNRVARYLRIHLVSNAIGLMTEFITETAQSELSFIRCLQMTRFADLQRYLKNIFAEKLDIPPQHIAC